MFDSDFEKRFHSRYTRGNGCWLWSGACDQDGYGVIKYKKRQYRVHRVMYELCNGPIPNGKVVMHTCDVPGCVRPDHLKVGTNLENTRDMVSKGRKHLTIGSKAQQGVLNGRARLTEEDVRKIRRRFAEGELQINLAPEFGITQGAVHKIIARRTWKHVSGDRP
jgi:hypothetical protein